MEWCGVVMRLLCRCGLKYLEDSSKFIDIGNGIFKN